MISLVEGIVQVHLLTLADKSLVKFTMAESIFAVKELLKDEYSFAH